MHPEADALLDAIFDHPDDDTPRLVYADWLREHGQEDYAQFIRLQCAAAREKLWSDESNRLWEEIGRVWSRLGDEWWPATRDEWPCLCASLDAINFHRGFLRDSIPLTYTQLVTYSRSCWPWLPLPVTTLAPDFTAEGDIEATPRLSRIRTLRLAWWYDDHTIYPFIESPRLSNLEVLDMTAGVMSVGEVEGMLKPGLFSRLREIRLKVYDEHKDTTVMAGCLPEAEPDAVSPQLRNLRRRAEARFENVVWLTTP